MTAQQVGHHEQSPSRRSAAARVGLAALGVAAVVLGVLLLTSPVGAARSLAWLVGVGLVLGGVMEMVDAADAVRRWPGLVLGALLIAGGVIAVFWPGVTLWSLAIIAGVTLVLHGVIRVALAVKRGSGVDRRGWLALGGVVNILVGVLALSWPGATVLVLCLLFGIQVMVFGIVLVVGAFLAGPAADG